MSYDAMRFAVSAVFRRVGDSSDLSYPIASRYTKISSRMDADQATLHDVTVTVPDHSQPVSRLLL